MVGDQWLVPRWSGKVIRLKFSKLPLTVKVWQHPSKRLDAAIKQHCRVRRSTSSLASPVRSKRRLREPNGCSSRAWTQNSLADGSNRSGLVCESFKNSPRESRRNSVAIGKPGSRWASHGAIGVKSALPRQMPSIVSRIHRSPRATGTTCRWEWTATPEPFTTHE